MMVEYWDIYDIERNTTGKLHQRGVELKEGEYHLVVEVWVIDSSNKILLTKRHPEKPWGCYWECTGGSVTAGEDSVTGARRELLEEIGVEIEENQINFLGTITYKGFFIDTYLVRKDILLSELKLQPEEVIDVKWVSTDEFNTMCSKGLIVPATVERFNTYESDIFQDSHIYE